MAAIDDKIDGMVEGFAKSLAVVMRRLDRELQSVIAPAATASQVFNASVLSNPETQAAMIQALRDSGYMDLAASFIGQFEQIPGEVSTLFDSLNLPAPKFTTADAELFRQLSNNDFTRFLDIGESAVNELRTALVADAVAGVPFADMVERVNAATVGIDGKNSPLANHAFTHANTAVLEFSGQAAQAAGESIGFDGPDSLWQVVGPDDSVTRDVCLAALAEPIRTKQEWQDAGYWGGTPGGWNCRHILVPFVGEL